ncbi:MAG TPA: hypothetical protein PL011_03480 [Kiritimatiellia bacterium]|nr:hypothetical protein [Kiritimatiellia bacterium]
MKETPQDKSLEERLGASRFSGEGFLGTDHRPVDEIIAADLHALRELDIPLSRLLAALRAAFDQARGALGGEVDIRPGVTAVAHESMGRIPSPFQGDGVFEKGDVVLTDSATGEELVLTALGLSMIEKHRFFQGRGSRYRVEPARAARLLGLIPSPPPA